LAAVPGIAFAMRDKDGCGIRFRSFEKAWLVWVYLHTVIVLSSCSRQKRKIFNKDAVLSWLSVLEQL
jgi:hypothetical protein